MFVCAFRNNSIHSKLPLGQLSGANPPEGAALGLRLMAVCTRSAMTRSCGPHRPRRPACRVGDAEVNMTIPVLKELQSSRDETY